MNELIGIPATQIAFYEIRRYEPFEWSPQRQSLVAGARSLVGESLVGLGNWIKPQPKPAGLKPTWQGR